MQRLALSLLALATLTTGCAGMGTKRTTGSQIQRTEQQPSDPNIGGDLQGRPELGQR
jgi:hypothetical protein